MNVGGILKAELAGLADEWDVERGGEKGRVKDLSQVANYSHSVDGGDIFLIFIFYIEDIYFLNWRTTALQSWVSFYCTTMRISCKYTYIPSPLSLPPLPSHPSRSHRAVSWAPCVTRQLPTSHLFCTRQCIHVNATLSVRPTISFHHYVHKSVLDVCVSSPVLQIGASVPYLCVNIQYLFFSYFTLYNRV